MDIFLLVLLFFEDFKSVKEVRNLTQSLVLTVFPEPDSPRITIDYCYCLEIRL